MKGDAAITLSGTWSPDKGLKIDGSAAIEIAIPGACGHRPGGDRDDLSPLGARAGRQDTGRGLRRDQGLARAAHRQRSTASGSRPTSPSPGTTAISARSISPSASSRRTASAWSLDGGGFKGGGFLYLDIPKGEYAGALELSFQGIVDVQAIGILNTKLPDGQPGFSLLILISAEFAPIQLSFGFTLIGVGGLIGLNRTILFDPLRAGVRDGSLNSVLFPHDVVANAPRIIGDLKRIFPPMDGRFLIGPMAKLGWGTPTIVSLELGLLLEIPRPAFAIAGVLRITLPIEEAALIKIQVNFLGIVDFEKKQLSFDASLYDSYVLFMTLTGDMAVRVYWGDDANFLLSVGGFHPSYRPPPAMGLGDLARLAIIISQPQPLIRAEVYFAVTSNTVQFGAKVELMAGASIFNVYGFLSLDALIQFDPFQFVVEIAGMLAVRSGSSVLFAIRLELTLSGPSPWHAKGKGSFEIGFIFTITITVHFDITVGEETQTSLPPIAVIDVLLPALNDDARLAGAAAQRVFAAGEPPRNPGGRAAGPASRRRARGAARRSCRSTCRSPGSARGGSTAAPPSGSPR